jgi:hypothetical protein
VLAALASCRTPSGAAGASSQTLDAAASEAAAARLETIPAGEAEATAKIQAIISGTIVRDYPAGVRPARRDAHAKHHGCVLADFDVNETLASDLAIGVFKPGAHYKAWIRYSNGSGKDQADTEGDGRGMAIKLTGVPGDKLLEAEKNEQTQDFLMINHPAFFVRNAIDYVDFSQRSADGDPFTYFISLNPLDWHLHELTVARAIQKKKVGNPLKVQYWSMTPYLLGEQAVKFTAKPCFTGDDAPGTERDYLRAAMKKKLDAGAACYEFFVQTQGSASAMPIEDPTITWSETASAPRKVATITIPKQTFDSKAQQDFCENLSYTPWHSLPEHRPLGGINRVRKTVYEAISALRHKMNGAARAEPTGMETFQ